jgi:hypothetical protein
MSQELPFDDQLEELRSELASLDKARGDALESYIEGLDQDESDMAYGQEDEDDENTVTKIGEMLDAADELHTEIEDVDSDVPEAERNELVEKLTKDRDQELAKAREDMADFRASLKKRGIEPED